MKTCLNCANCGAPPLDRYKCLYCGSLFQDELINSIQNDQFNHQLRTRTTTLYGGYITSTLYGSYITNLSTNGQTCVDLGHAYVRQLG